MSSSSSSKFKLRADAAEFTPSFLLRGPPPAAAAPAAAPVPGSVATGPASAAAPASTSASSAGISSTANRAGAASSQTGAESRSAATATKPPSAVDKAGAVPDVNRPKHKLSASSRAFVPPTQAAASSVASGSSATAAPSPAPAPATSAPTAAVPAASAARAPSAPRSGEPCKYSLESLRAIKEETLSLSEPPASAATILQLPTMQIRLIPQGGDRGTRSPRREGGAFGESRTGGRDRRGAGAGPAEGWREAAPKSIAEENLNPDGTPVLAVAATPWKPKVVAGAGDEDESVEAVIRRARVLLNKLSVDKFDRISAAFCSEVKIKSEAHMTAVIDLIIEKAQDEPNYAFMYAQLCRRFNDAVGADWAVTAGITDPAELKHKQFKYMLLSNCQKQFLVMRPRPDDYDELTDEDKAEVDLIRRQMVLGHVTFIGELYKEELLSEKVMFVCMRQMLTGCPHEPNEDHIDALSKLLLTIGSTLELVRPSPKGQSELNIYFKLFKQMLDSDSLPPRMRFQFMELVDLRSNQWVPRREEEKVQSIKEFHESVRRKELRASRSRGNRTVRAHVSAPVVDADGWEVVRGTGVRALPAHTPRSRDTSSSAGAASPSRGGTRGNGFSALSSQSSRKKDKHREKDASSKTSSKKSSRSKDSSSHDASGASTPTATASVHTATAGAGGASAGAGGSSSTTPSGPYPRAQLKRVAKELLLEFEANGEAEIDAPLMSVKEAVAAQGTDDSALVVVPQLVEMVLDNALNSRTPLETAKRTAELFRAMFDRTTSSPDGASSIGFTEAHISQGVANIMEFLDDIKIDIPRVSQYMGQLLGWATHNGVLSLAFIESKFTHLLKGIVESGSAQAVLKEILEINKAEGTTLSELVTKQGIDPAKWCKPGTEVAEAFPDL